MSRDQQLCQPLTCDHVDTYIVNVVWATPVFYGFAAPHAARGVFLRGLRLQMETPESQATVHDGIPLRISFDSLRFQLFAMTNICTHLSLSLPLSLPFHPFPCCSSVGLIMLIWAFVMYAHIGPVTT